MTEMTQGMSQSTDTPVSQPVSTSAPASPAQVEERFLKQSEVNDIVGKAKHEAVERYKRSVEQQPQGQVHQQQQSMQPNDDHYRKIASEEAQRLRDQWINEAKSKSEADNAQKIVQSFWDKITPGKEKYQDFDKVTGDIEYARFPNVVQLLAQHVDNSHDVLYELGKDRIKMGNLEQLASMSPRDAIVHAQRLAQSIKDNETAGKVRIPHEPLSQMRPSNTGTDNGVMGVKDLRAKYRG